MDPNFKNIINIIEKFDKNSICEEIWSNEIINHFKQNFTDDLILAKATYYLIKTNRETRSQIYYKKLLEKISLTEKLQALLELTNSNSNDLIETARNIDITKERILRNLSTKCKAVLYGYK